MMKLITRDAHAMALNQNSSGREKERLAHIKLFFFFLTRETNQMIREAGPYLRSGWDYFIDVLTVLAVVAGVVSAIFAAIFANNVGVRQTYLIGSADPTGLPDMRGVLVTDSESDKVEYDLVYKASLAPILSIALVGPLNVDTGTGPIFFGLCGCPPGLVCGAETPACDTSTPQILKGSISQIQPGALSLREPIRDLRSNRMDYEFRVFNAASPSGMGAYQSKLPSGGS